MPPTYVVQRGICYDNVCPSVFLSVTLVNLYAETVQGIEMHFDLRCIQYLEAKLRIDKAFKPQASALKREHDVESKDFTNTPRYLENGVTQDVC